MKKLLLFLLGILPGIFAYGQIPTANLLGEYKFTQGSLNSAVGTNHFTQTGSALNFVSNRAGGTNRAISLNGDHLQRTGTTGNSFSVSFWIKTTTNDANKRVIIDQSERATQAEGAAETGWYVYLINGKIELAGNFQWYRNGNTANGVTGYIGWHTVSPITVIADGNWHHVAITSQPYAAFENSEQVVKNTYKVYIDNTLIITQDATKILGAVANPQMRRFIAATTPITIGNSRLGNSTNRFMESIDDVRYYNATLTAGNVTALATETACAGSTSVNAVAKNITVQLNASGNATITANDINDGSTNTCGDPVTVSLDITSFTCDDLGPNTVTLTAEDEEGNSDIATATVTVIPTIVVSTISSIFILPVGANGTATLTPADINNGTSASCGTAGLTMTLSKTNFTCSDVGANTQVTLTVEDAYGNQETGTAWVRAEDTTAPTAVAQNISVQLNATTGLATITPAMVNNGSTDNCAVNLSLSKTQFTCDDLGENTVTLTVTDNRSNSSTATAVVTVTSIIVNETVSTATANFCTDGSSGTTISTSSSVVGVNYFLRNSADNSIVDGPIAGTGSALNFNTGNLSAKTTFNVFAEIEEAAPTGSVLDFDGVNDKVEIPYAGALVGTSAFTIEAWIKPAKTSYGRVITRFSGTGNTAGDVLIDTGTPQNNGRGLRLYMVRSNAVATNIAIDNVLTLNTWNHIAATFNAGTMTLYVNGVQVSTGAFGQASIVAPTTSWVLGEDRGGTVAEYFAGKMDEVRFWNIARTAQEIQGNMNSCLVGNETGLTAYYKLDDGIGSTTITDNSVNSNNGNLLNMDANTDWVQEVVLTCQQQQGCGVQMNNEVTIGDLTNPTATAQNITIQLDATGNATISAAAINNGSSDDCTTTGNLLLTLDKSSFTCADIGANLVTLTVEDASGNETTAAATVTVEDALAPTVLTKNITVNLDNDGNASITATDVNNGSTDNCTDQANLIVTIDAANFTLANVGPNVVTLTVTDAHGNSNTATSTVTIVDKTEQTITFPALTNKLYGSGNFTLTATASSGLPVSYTVVSGAATIEGSTVSITGVGDVTIEATQAGDAEFMPAPGVQQSFTVNPAVLSITATNHAITHGAALPTLTYTYSGFVAEESAAVLTSVPTIATTATANSDAGSYPITLSGGSALNYAITLLDGTLTINKANQTVSITSISNKNIDDAAFAVIASTTSGLTLTYAITGPATIEGTLITLTGAAGTVTVTASQAGTININAASASTSFQVIDNSKQAQTITFNAIADQILEEGTLTLSATASSGLTVTFQVVSGPATISGNVVSLNNLGVVVIRANQAGNNSFHPATSVERSFTIATITAVEEKTMGVHMYPNPVSDYLQIDMQHGEDAQISLLTNDGREVWNKPYTTERIDISALKKGIYFVRVQTADKTLTRKIIKN